MLLPRLTLLFLFALAFDCFAQPLAERREISGRVWMTQKKPVLGAQVTIRRKEAQGIGAFWGATVATNISGDWSVPHAEEGDYIVEVSAPGYETWISDYKLGPYSPPLRVVLQRTIRLSFTLLNPHGEPVRGQRASVFGYITAAGEWQSENVTGASLGLTTVSDSKGVCHLSNQGEGVFHRIFVSVRGIGYAVWPGKTQILEGGTHHIELQLKGSLASLRVKVIENSADHQERTVGKASVYQHDVRTPDKKEEPLARWLFGENASETWDGDGFLHLSNLLPGRYTLSAAAPDKYRAPDGSAKVRQSTEITVELEANREKELLFHLPAPAAKAPALEVTLQDKNGVPVANREFRLYGQKLDELTGLEEGAASLAPSFSGRLARTDANGKAVLYPFWAGLWRITATEIKPRLPFQGKATVHVLPEGGQLTILVSLGPVGEEF